MDPCGEQEDEDSHLQAGPYPLTVRLANQQRVTIIDCLKGVDVEFQGRCIKTDLWIHDDSDTEGISLGKSSMQQLGFGLTNPSGQNLWTQKDPRRSVPVVAAS